jgi:O-methyltransferase
MLATNLVRSLARTVAIGCFGVLTRAPAISNLLPSARHRRLIAIAGLPDLRYSGIYTQSAYAPWKGDAEFQSIFSVIRSHTLVDEYRCYELWTLCKQIEALDPGDVLEIGVWRGGTGCLLGAGNRNSQSTVFLCDTFLGVVNAGDQDSAYVGGEHADTSADVVLALARRVGLTNIEVLQGAFPDETAYRIADRQFRLCHIDVDVYESAARCFAWVWSRLVPGGIVVFDDYGFYSCGGVTRFVERMRGEADRLVLYNINGHAIVIKREILASRKPESPRTGTVVNETAKT